MNSRALNISLFLLLLIMPINVFAFDLDETVDDEIRKTYNDSKLIKDTHVYTENESLPDLPSITKYEKTTGITNNQTQPSITNNNSIPEISSVVPTQSIEYKAGNIKVKKGTTFNVFSSNAVSDNLNVGTKIKFVTKTPVHEKKYTIPAWTSFQGEIVEKHQPQITCNGGLVVIKIYSMTYKGQTIPINAYITRANDKVIMFNDIKGERSYLKTMWKKGNWGRSLFNRMLNLTVNLGGDSSTLVLAPFPFLYGSICLGFNTLTSPVTAFFSKGGHVSIPAGKPYRIKLVEDIYIN